MSASVNIYLICLPCLCVLVLATAFIHVAKSLLSDVISRRPRRTLNSSVLEALDEVIYPFLKQVIYPLPLCVPLTILAVFYLFRKRARLWRRGGCRRIASASPKIVQVTVTLMSGRTIVLDAIETKSISEVKQALAGLDVAPSNQIRLFNACREMNDSDLLGACDSTCFSLVLRSKQCAEWLESFSRGEGNLYDAADEVRESKECAIVAAEKFGLATLRQMPWLADDEEVVTAAVVNDGLALYFASPRFRLDQTLALTAISRNRLAIGAVREPLRSDPDFLRRAYWASSLDCISDKIARRSKRSDPLPSTLDTWEDMLYKRCGTAQRMFWSSLHLRLRDPKVSDDFSVMFSGILALLLVSPGESLLMWIIAFLCSMITFGIMHTHALPDMHVEFAAYMAGHLLKPRRSGCRGGVLD